MRALEFLKKVKSILFLEKLDPLKRKKIFGAITLISLILIFTLIELEYRNLYGGIVSYKKIDNITVFYVNDEIKEHFFTKADNCGIYYGVNDFIKVSLHNECGGKSDLSRKFIEYHELGHYYFNYYNESRKNEIKEYYNNTDYKELFADDYAWYRIYKERIDGTLVEKWGD